MDEQIKALRNEIMANRLVIRTLVATVAQLANRNDPRDYVSSIEEAIFAQLDTAGPIWPDDTGTDREIIKRGVRDVTGRLNWGSD